MVRATLRTSGSDGKRRSSCTVLQSFAQLTGSRHIGTEWQILHLRIANCALGFTVVNPGWPRCKALQERAGMCQTSTLLRQAATGRGGAGRAQRRTAAKGRAHHVEADWIRHRNRGRDDRRTARGTTTMAAACPDQGVTSTTIKVGIPYLDLSSLASQGVKLTQGSWPDAYGALIANLNAHGGISRPKDRGLLRARELGQRHSGRGLGLHHLDGGRSGGELGGND